MSDVVMKAKMRVTEINRTEGVERLKMVAVGGEFGTDGESEDNTYARWTPQGELTITVNNPDLLAVWNPGDKVYLNFVKAEEPAE